MKDKKKNLPVDEEVELVEQEELLEEEEELVDHETHKGMLLADIAFLKEKENILTKNLSQAKDKAMNAEAEKLRVLLQRVVLERREMQEALKIVEDRIRETKAREFAEQFSEEVDQLTAEIEQEVFGVEEEEPETAPLFEAEYDHMAKSRRLTFIAKTFAWVGILAGLLSSLAYMLLVEFAWFEFSWVELSVFGGFTVLMLLIGLCIGGASNKHKRIAAEIEQEIAELEAQFEAERLERERQEAEEKASWRNENMDAILEAYALEKASDNKRAAKKAMQKLIPDVSDTEKLKKTVHKVAPIAVACTAVAVAALVAGNKKKSAQKRSSAIRREFFDWLT